MIDPHNPPEWVFVVGLFFCSAVVVALTVGIGGCMRLAEGKSFWPNGDREEPAEARSRVRGSWVRRVNLPAYPGMHVRRTLRRPDGTFAGSEGSRSSSESPESSSATGTLDMTLDEIAWGMLAVMLRTRGEQPTKEAAIIAAFPHVKSKGGGSWKRASQVYDTIAAAEKQATSSPASGIVPQKQESTT